MLLALAQRLLRARVSREFAWISTDALQHLFRVRFCRPISYIRHCTTSCEIDLLAGSTRTLGDASAYLMCTYFVFDISNQFMHCLHIFFQHFVFGLYKGQSKSTTICFFSVFFFVWLTFVYYAFSTSWEGPYMVAVRKRKREHMSPWYVHILSIARLYGIHTWRRIVINLKRYRNGLHMHWAYCRWDRHTYTWSNTYEEAANISNSIR